MIRLYTALCKALLRKIPTDEELFSDSAGSFNCFDIGCPKCGAIGKYIDYGSYGRYLISFESDKIAEHIVSILRVKCASCKSTHALLPYIIVPYSPYSLRFKLLSLIAYYERDTSVVSVCEQFQIAISTLYGWKKLMAEHKDLMLGLLISSKTPALAFLKGLLESSRLPEQIRGFFRKYAFSFLQNQSAPPSRTRPP